WFQGWLLAYIGEHQGRDWRARIHSVASLLCAPRAPHYRHHLRANTRFAHSAPRAPIGKFRSTIEIFRSAICYARCSKHYTSTKECPMPTHSETFGRLLKGAINSIAAYEGKTAPAIEDEIGGQVGLSSSAIQRYKTGHLPPDPRAVQVLA